MPRRRFIYDPEAPDQWGGKGAMVEVPTDYAQQHHYVIPDIPDYVSPVTGLVVSGRRQRREDMKRTNSRPWEGLSAEKKEAARQRVYAEAKQDARLHEHASRAYYQLSPEKRRALEGR